MPFVGRGTDVQALQRAYESTDTATVVISGEGGIGKTRLVQELIRRADAPSVWIACFQLAGEPVAFSALLRALEPLSPPAPENLSIAGTSAQLRHFERWLTGLLSIAGGARAVLVVDDAHWADETTLAFLSFLAHLAPAEDLLTVLTLRDDESAVSRSTAMQDILRQHRTRTLALQRLADDDAGELVSRLGAQPDSREDLVTRGGGNPYLLGELVAGQGQLPDRVRDLLLLRTAQLTDDADAVVRLAALAGPTVDDRVLFEASGLELARYGPAVRELLEAGVLVRSQDAYTFRHSLVREALVARELPSERVDGHRALADALARLPSEPGTSAALALHWNAAGDPSRAAAASVAAGREAFAANAFAEAAVHFERALALGYAEDPVIFRWASDAARWSGELATALRLAERGVASASDPVQKAQLLEQLGRCLWEFGRGRESSRVLDEALSVLGSTADPAAASVEVSVTAALARNAMVSSRHVEAEQQAYRALELARAIGARATEADALITFGVARALQGDPDGAGSVRQGLLLARDIDDREAICRAYANLVFVLDLLGQTQECSRVASDGLRYLRACGLELGVSAMFVNNAVAVLVDRGRLDEAESLLDDLFAGTPQRGLNGSLWLDRARLALLRGRLVEARAAVEAVAGLEVDDDAWVMAEIAMVRARLLSAEGRGAEAVRLVRQAAAALPPDELSLRTQVCRAWFELAADAGEQVEAAQLLPPVPEPSDSVTLRLDRAIADAEARRCAGEDTADDWAGAAELARVAERPLDVAYASYRQASALAQRRRSAAAVIAAQALEIADAAGAVPLSLRLRELQRRARLDPGARHHPAVPAQHVPDPLTPRELDVLELLAAGATNRQIGRKLFITERTAEVHVSRVLRKLGVRNRTEAAALAAGLTRPVTVPDA